MAALEDYQQKDIATLENLFLNEDPRGIEEIIAQDENYEAAVVTEVEPYDDLKHVSIVRDDGWGLGITVPDDLDAPKVGQLIKVYSHGIGLPIYGYSFDGVVYKYETEWEQFATRITMLAVFDRENRDNYTRNKADIAHWYSQLEGLFKKRIDFLREKDPMFDIEGGSYETYPCLMAQRIYIWCIMHDKTAKDFKNLNYEDQKPTIHGNEGNKYGISGWQFEWACGFAEAVLNDEVDFSEPS